jgi:hypothetical protein
VKPHRYVVFAGRMRGFDALEDARAFATANPPAVICERVPILEGGSELREILRHDFLYDAASGQWRMMMG